MLFKTQPLYQVPASPLHADAVIHLETTYRAALAAYKAALKDLHLNGRLPYLCLGCQVGNGSLRRQMLGFAAYPLYQLAAEERLGVQLVLQAYHPAAYEPGADEGPGGVIGVKLPKLFGTPDLRPSTAQKMWLWVDKNEPSYLPEEQAAEQLWQLAEQRCPDGLRYLTNHGTLPPTAWAYPPELEHDLHTLLGVPALRQLVIQKLGIDVVLLDATRLITRPHLNWAAL